MKNKKYKYKREFIGKIDSSGKKIMYDKKHVNLPTPKASKSYGNIYFLEQVANNIELTDILKNIFKDEYDVLITIVHYIICVDSSLSNSIK